MKSITISAKTIEEAIDLALVELKAKREDVEYNVLEEGSKGVLGIFGKKDAVVTVRVVNDYIEKAEEFLMDVLRKMDLNTTLKSQEENNILFIEILNVSDGDAGIIIGKRGETLDSLQYLTNIVANQFSNHFVRVSLDIQEYRKRRETTLREFAKKMAKKALENKRNYKLEPMNPFERRIIHSELQKIEGISSRSEGNEPYRKLVIIANNKRKNPV